MKTIDERIVDMQFNNKQFEDGIKTTLSSLDKLKNSLKLDGATKSLSELDRAGRKFSLSGISEGIDKLNAKFNMMSVIGITAITNLTNVAINSGKRLVSALTIDPIKTGLNEYETKINAIQTILTNTESKGTTLKDVTATLNELNEYSDKTIYNFAEMARNIGTFTAAGVDLKTSATSIKGIANLAAASGSNAQQASTAMYQLSQAIASGSVKLMDWNSVVNAGMGGELFQKALRATAKEMGAVVDEGKPFRETLESGWLTAEVLTKTLEKFANDESLIKAATQVKTFTQMLDTMKESVQSGWAQSWEMIIGDKDEAAKLFTGINDGFGAIVGSSADARNSMLAFWKANGGREAVINTMANSLKLLSSVLKPIKEGFRDIFPAMTGQKLTDLSKSMKAVSDNFKIGEVTTNNIKRTFSGLFAVLDIGKILLGEVGKGLLSLLDVFGPLGKGILSVTALLGDAIVSLRNSLKEADGVTEFVKKLKELFTPALTAVKDTIQTLSEGLMAIGSIDTTGLDTFTKKMTVAFSPLITLSNVLMSILTKVFPIVASVFDSVGQVVVKLFEKINSELKKMDFETIISIINGAFLMGILGAIDKFIKQLTEITGGGTKILGNITSLLDGVGDCLEAYQKNLQAKTLLTIAMAVGVLAAALIALSLVDGKKLTMSLEALSILFAQMFVATGVFGKMLSGAKLLSSLQAIVVINGLALAIVTLADAMTKIADISWGDLLKGVVAISALTVILGKASSVFDAGAKNLIRGSIGIVIFAGAMRLLVESVKALGLLDIPTLTKGLVGVGILVTELAVFLNLADFSKMGPSAMIGLIGVATAINILAIAVGKFGAMDTSTITKGLVSVGAILGELIIFINLSGNAKHLISTAIGLNVLASAMLLFGMSISKLGSLPVETLAKGIGAMALSLTAVALGMRLMPSNLILTGVGLIGVAVAINMLSLALVTLGKMSLNDIGKSLLALGGALAILAGGMMLMAAGLPGALAMVVMAGALAVFVPLLGLLSSIPFTGIVVGLVAIAGAFTIIGIAGLVLAPLTTTIAALSASILLLGAGILAVGGGVTLFGTGLALLANSLGLFVNTIITSISKIIKGLPAIFVLLTELVKGFAKVLGEAAPALISSFVVLIDSIVSALTISVPKVTDLFILLITDILSKFATAVPVFVTHGANIIIGFLKGVSTKLPEVISAGVDIITKFLRGVADNIGKVVKLGIEIIVNFLNGVTSMLGKVIQAGFNLMLAFINGLADAIRKNTPLMISAIGNLMTAIGEAGIKTLTSAVKGIVNVLANTVGDFMEAGKNLIKGFIDGIKSKIAEAAKVAAELAKAAIDAAKEALDIHSPSRVFKGIGQNTVIGFINGMEIMGPQLQKSTNATFKMGVIDPIKKAMDETKKAMNFGSGAFKVFLTEFSTMTNTVKDITAFKTASDAITKYGKLLYLESEQYKEDTQAAKEHKKQLLDLETLRKKINENIAKEERTKKKGYKGRIEKFKNELKQVDEAVKAAKEQLIIDQKDIVTHTKDAYVAMHTSIKDVIKSTIDPIKQSLDTQINLFKKFGSDTDITVKEILENMQSQIVGIKQWNSDLDILAKRGLAVGLLEELKKLGPEGSAHVKAFMTMTTEEMLKANAAFQESAKMTADTLITSFETSLNKAREWGKELATLAKMGLNQDILENLASAGLDSEAYIDAFLTMTPEQIAKVNSLYKDSLSLPTSVADEVLASFAYAGTDAAKNFAAGLSKLGLPGTDANKQIVATTTGTVKTASNTANPLAVAAGEAVVTNLGKGVVAEQPEAVKVAKNLGTAVYDSLKGVLSEEAGKRIGNNVTRGLELGIMAGQSSVINAAISVAMAAIAAAQSALGIHSPSTEFAELGMYACLGLVVGLNGYQKVVSGAAAEVGNIAVESLRTTLANVSDIIDGKINTNPIIRPVLDLTDIESGSSEIAKMLSKNFALKTANSKIPVIKSNNQAVTETKTPTQASGNTSVQFVQNNYSPKALSRLDIYRQTNNQIKLMKGVVTSS